MLRTSRSNRSRAGWHVVLGAMTLAIGASCAIPAAPDGESGELPDSKSFIESGVSEFMERRCASIDCHGQMSRPLRLYSEWGLRLTVNDDGSRFTGLTTKEERLANYRSVVGLEPEALEACFRSKGAKADFQLLLKPLGADNQGIRHKGGSVLRPSGDDPGWECLFGWASGDVSQAECAKAARVSP